MKKITLLLLVAIVATMLFTQLIVTGDSCPTGETLFHKTEPPDHKCMQKCKKTDYNGEGWSKGSCPPKEEAIPTNTSVPAATETTVVEVLPTDEIPTPKPTDKPENDPDPTNTPKPESDPGDPPSEATRVVEEIVATATSFFAGLVVTPGVEICQPVPNCEICCNEASIDALNYALADEAEAKKSMWEAITDAIKETGVLPPLLIGD